MAAAEALLTTISPVLLLEEQDFIAGFQTELLSDFYGHSDLTVCRDFRQIHTSHPFYSLELKFSLSLLMLYPIRRRKQTRQGEKEALACDIFVNLIQKSMTTRLGGMVIFLIQVKI